MAIIKISRKFFCQPDKNWSNERMYDGRNHPQMISLLLALELILTNNFIFYS